MQTMHRIALLKLQTFLWFLLVCGVVGLAIPPQISFPGVCGCDMSQPGKGKKVSNGKAKPQPFLQRKNLLGFFAFKTPVYLIVGHVAISTPSADAQTPPEGYTCATKATRGKREASKPR